MRLLRRGSGTSRLLLMLLALVLLYAIDRLPRQFLGEQRTSELGPQVSTVEEGAASEAVIVGAFQQRRSGFWVELVGVVETILPDDTKGDRHQRFILRLASGHTLLISHNIDLARRVPLAVGDTVHLCGQYEWNDEGGVIHWTHRDLLRSRPGGWIEHHGTRYR